MKLSSINNLLCEVAGNIAKFEYNKKTDRHRAGATRYVLILGEYNLGKGPRIAAIDLNAAVGKHGEEALAKLRQYLPEILGFSDQKLGKPELNTQVLKTLSREDARELYNLVVDMQKNRERWHQKLINKDYTKDQSRLLKCINNLPQVVKLQDRPLKSTAQTTGRYDMGRREIKDQLLQMIFDTCYRTYDKSKIKKGLTKATIEALDNPEELKSKLKLYADGLTSIENTMRELLEEPEAEPGAKPIAPEEPEERIPELEGPEEPEPVLKPEVEPVAPEEPEERIPELEEPEPEPRVATPEKPELQPAREPEIAPKPKKKFAPLAIRRLFPRRPILKAKKPEPEELEPEEPNPEEIEADKKKAQEDVLGPEPE